MSRLLPWLEQSGLGYFMRESGPWTYPVVNLAHVLGIALLFGSVVVVDLALVRRPRPVDRLAAVADAASPIAMIGFALAVVSGAGLLASNGSEYIGNPFFLIKFPAIALGAVNAWLLTRSAAWRALRAGTIGPRDLVSLRLRGGLSLLCWLVAIAAGRMIGYW